MTAIFKAPSINFIQDHLLRDIALSKIIEVCFNKLPEANILDERIEDGQYLRKETWDILSHDLYFNPVGFSYIRLNTDNKLALERLRLIEDIQDLEMEVSEIKKDSSYEEVKKYLGNLYYGRQVTLKQKGVKIGELLEFVACQPNTKIKISLFDYITFNVHKKALTQQRIEDLFLHIKAALDAEVTVVLKNLLFNIPDDDLERIEKEIKGLDHIAFMALPFSQKNILDEESIISDFPDNHVQFESSILAKELGSSIGLDTVPTQIFKASGYNRHQEKVSVEVFIPKDTPEHIQEWIDQGMGAHIAFKVKDRNSIDIINTILRKYRTPIPAFMHGKPMENKIEKSVVLYLEVPFHDHKFRMELFYKPD